MRLSTAQEALLFELRRANLVRVEAAVRERQLQERCWEHAIPATRIAQASGVSTAAITKRFAAAYASGRPR